MINLYVNNNIKTILLFTQIMSLDNITIISTDANMKKLDLSIYVMCNNHGENLHIIHISMCHQYNLRQRI